MYAWIIDQDHLWEEDGSFGPSESGITGPRDAPDWACDMLRDHTYHRRQGKGPNGESVQQFTFKMHDDDGELYYTGRMLTDEIETIEPAGWNGGPLSSVSEAACFGPLGDFGTPNAGATLIEYLGHPEMDVG
jgi:hypothetical protein